MNSEKIYDNIYTFDDQDSALDQDTATGETEYSFAKYKEWGEKVLGAANATGAEAATTPEASREKSIEKVKKKGAFNKLKAIALGLAMSAALTACASNHNVAEKPASAEASPAIEDQVERPASHRAEVLKEGESLTGFEVLDEKINGTFEQYDNPGGHDRQHSKVSPEEAANMAEIYSPTSVANVADILNFMRENDLIKDPDNITPEEWGTAYKFVTFSEKEPAAYVAIGADLEGFEGLTYHQAVAKIDSMSPAEKQSFQAQLKHLFDRTTFTEGKVEGTIDSYYIGEKNGEKQGFVDAVKLNKATATLILNISSEKISEGDKYVMTEDGQYLPASALASESKDDDGKTTKITILKRCFNGNKLRLVIDNGTGEPQEVVIDIGEPDADIPTQEVKEDDGDPDEPEKPKDEPKKPQDTPDKPQGTPEKPQDEPNVTPKNIVAERENAGPDVTPLPLDEKVTPKTTLEQDQANFAAIRQQEEDAKKAAEEAAKRAAEQAEAEKKAAAEAEARRQAEKEAEERRLAEIAERARQEELARQRANDEAARRAAEEAARRAAEEERAREAERQRQADEAAARAEAEAKARQEAAAAAERQRQAEEEARARAQAEANRLAEQQRREAEANANATASERADIFNSGDF